MTHMLHWAWKLDLPAFESACSKPCSQTWSTNNTIKYNHDHDHDGDVDDDDDDDDDDDLSVRRLSSARKAKLEIVLSFARRSYLYCIDDRF